MVIKTLFGDVKMNKTIYGTVPIKSLRNNYSDIINQIYKLLPLKENNNSDIDYYFSTLLFRIRGMSNLFPNEPRWITILALIEAARHENDFKLYRKAVLDSCSLIKKMGEY